MPTNPEASETVRAYWSAEIDRLREELLRAEQIFSEALQDQRDRIAFAEEQLQASLKAVRLLRKESPLTAIMVSLAKATGQPPAPAVGLDDDVQEIINSEKSRSAKAKILTTYILRNSSKPLKNSEILDEYDRLGVVLGPSGTELMAESPRAYKNMAKAETKSFNQRWGLVRHAFDEHVVKLDDNTYWLDNHPLGKKSHSDG